MVRWTGVACRCALDALGVIACVLILHAALQHWRDRSWSAPLAESAEWIVLGEFRARQTGPHLLRVRFEAVDAGTDMETLIAREELPFGLEWQLDHERVQTGRAACSFLSASSSGFVQLLLHEQPLARGEQVRLSVRVGRIPVEYQGRVQLEFGPRGRLINPDLFDLLVILLTLRLVWRVARWSRSRARHAKSAHSDAAGIGTVAP